MAFDGIVRVFNKKRQLIAVFDGQAEALNEEQERNQMVAPTVRRETNGESTLTFQMLVKSEKWQTIKDPENIFVLNDREYTALSDGAYEYGGEGNAQIVTVKLVETWYLLDKKYVQAYNCGIYCYAKAKFKNYTTDGAIFTINASDCSAPDNAVSPALAWSQIKNWVTQDKDGNNLTYAIIKSDEFKPTNWEDAPAGVFFDSFSVSGNTATVTIKPRAKQTVRSTMDYADSNTFKLEKEPYPASLSKVYVNTTVKTETTDKIKYVTSTKETNAYNYSNGTLTLTYSPAKNETINSVIFEYEYSDLGTIKDGATCTFAYGAEVVDEHTFCILPKADSKYKLTVNGKEYNDNEVVDGRGVVMPRGSAGYAMWAALKDTDWKLGVCDVIAKGYDASIDYGCFNLECDMQHVLYIVQYIQELYGGILDWDSKNKVLNYRAENAEDYQAYEDGFNKWTGYEFRIGKNMTNQPKLTWDNELITKGYVLGYNNMNIKKVNGGKSYVENYSYTDKVYEGYLEQPLIYDTRDEGGMTQLKYWAEKEISKKCKPRIKITAEVTDIRTVVGYEHEVFDLNNIARVYYSDSETGEEKYEEKRITLWEYNAFAMWDCTVELGDKTQNFVELFKLIYNTAVENAPKTNARGQIGADEVVIEVQKFGGLDYDIEYGGDYGWSGGGYGGIGGYGGATLPEYIELLVQKTTEHTDALAGLTMEANELYSQTELFSSFQSVTENMVSETYAGLKTYADAEMSSISATVQGHYEEFGRFKTETNAGFVAQQDKNSAFTRQFSEVNKSITSLNGSIESQTQSLAELKTYADGISAVVTANAEINQRNYNSLTGKIDSVSKAQATFEAKVTTEYAKVSALAEYATKDYVTGAVTDAKSGFEAYANQNFTSATMFSKFTTDVNGNKTTNIAAVQTWANGKFAKASIQTTVEQYMTILKLENGNAYLMASQGSSKGYVQVQSFGAVSLYSTGLVSINGYGGVNINTQASATIKIGGASSSLAIKGHSVSWMSKTVLTGATLSGSTLNKTTLTLHYLGYS